MRVINFNPDTSHGPISKAVLHRAEAELVGLVKQELPVNEVDSNGCSPLHLSIMWPTGIKILLAAGVDRNAAFERKGNKRPKTALDLAIQYHQDEAIMLLLSANCALYPSKPNARIHSETALSLVIDEYSPSHTITKAVINALVERRKCLKLLAQHTLTTSELQNLCILSTDDSYHDELLLDEYAIAVADALETGGVAVPEALWPYGRSSVYDVYPSSLSPTVADALYSAGFRSINVPNRRGMTPMLQVCYSVDLCSEVDFKMILWFLEHGVDPMTRQSCNSWNALHFVAHKLNWDEISGPTQWHTVEKDVIRRLVFECGLATPDTCQCACSIRGCTPITLLLSIDIEPWREKAETLKLWCQTINLSPAASRACFAEFARMETFNRLGITHVCCRTEHPLFYCSDQTSQERAEETQGRESELIEQLESWMKIFECESLRFKGSDIKLLSRWLELLHSKDLSIPAHFDERWFHSDEGKNVQ